MHKCYLMIQPDPYETYGYRKSNANGQIATCFHIKFGDGEPDPPKPNVQEDRSGHLVWDDLKGAYSRGNANCRMAVNDSAPSRTLQVRMPNTGLDSRYEERGPGKYLEINFILIPGLLDPEDIWRSSRREWHTLVLRDENRLAEFTALLRRVLELFPHCVDWQISHESGGYSSTHSKASQEAMAALCWKEDPAGLLADVESRPSNKVLRRPRF